VSVISLPGLGQCVSDLDTVEFSFDPVDVRFAVFHDGRAGCEDTIAEAGSNRILQVGASGFAYRPELTGERCGRYQIDFGSRGTGQLVGAVVVNSGRDCGVTDPSISVPEPGTIFLLCTGLLFFLAASSLVHRRARC